MARSIRGSISIRAGIEQPSLRRRSFTSFTTSIDTDRIDGVHPCYIGLDQVHTPRQIRNHHTQVTSPKSILIPPRPMPLVSAFRETLA